MPNRHLRLYAALCAVVVIAAAVAHLSPARAQQRNAIDVYAITGARIVTASGPVIERGTIVIRNGVIAAVGANVTAPPDARIIDGAGLTVYPGLFDASTNLGVPIPTPTTRPSLGSFETLFGPATPPSATSPNSSQPAGLQPEILAADIIRPGGDQIEAARSAGVTTAQTAPRGNIFLGRSAVINLAGDNPQQMVVRSPVALYVGFTPLGTGGYPASLMGVFASLRQMLLDAQRYRESQTIYERNPRGLRRPAQDKSLEALLPVLARQMPVVMQADREREIRRALELAREFNLRLIIAGGMESWKVANELRAADVPVLLSLNFPRRNTTQSPEADPEPLTLLRDRVEAPRAAGRLAAAGVRFAFQSGSMSNMNDYLTNAARAVENGLARDEAVRALTLRPAQILGLDDRLGSVEVGKIANLTVTRGDIFDRTRRIAHVFIDGRPVELRPVTADLTGVNASGTWTLKLNLGGEAPEVVITLSLQQQGERLEGSMQGELGTSPITNAAALPSGEIRFTVPVTLPQQTQTTDAGFIGRISGNEMSGTVQVVGRGPGSFSGTRTGGAPATATPPAAQPGATPAGTTGTTAADLSGTWSVAFSAGSQAVSGTLTLRQQGDSLTGTLQTNIGSNEISNGTASAGSFRFTAPLDFEGQTFEFAFTGTASGGRMSGMVTTPRGPASFTATRPQ